MVSLSCQIRLEGTCTNHDVHLCHMWDEIEERSDRVSACIHCCDELLELGLR